MKRQLLSALILLFTATCSFAQLSPYFDKGESAMNATTQSLAPHGKLTQMTYFDMNFVNRRVQDFLSNELELTPDGEPTYDMGENGLAIIQRYHKKIQINHTKDFNLEVKYNLFPHGNDLVIESCEISGYTNYVLDFFVKYWSTTLNFEAAKNGEVVVNHLWQDRASFSTTGEDSKILVTNTTIKDSESFLEELQK